MAPIGKLESARRLQTDVEPELQPKLFTAAEPKYQLEDIATLEELCFWGERLDERPPELEGFTRGMVFAHGLKVRTRELGVQDLAPNRVQQLFEERRGARNIVLKARQLGLTTWTAARFFLRTIMQKGILTLQVAHTQQAAEEIFNIVRRFYDWLPERLRRGPLRTSRVNVRQIAFPELDSQYLVMTAGDRNVGRGLTVQNLHCSELARWPGDPAETLAGLRASMTPGAELVMESTPEGAGGCFHQEWLKADETGTVRHFFPWWLEPGYVAEPVDTATVSEEELELMTRPGVLLTPEQIGYRRRLRAGFGGLARQEYAEDPESCFRASGQCYFDIATVEARMKVAPEPHRKEHNGDLEIWLPPEPGRQYLVSVDPAGGGSEGDYSAMEVLDLASGMQCAEFAAHMGGLELAEQAAKLAEQYNRAWLVVERNNHGSAVLALLETVCRCERIYADPGGQAGWLTNSATKPAALSVMGAVLVQTPSLFQSRRLLGECRTFARQPNGSLAARPGTHDDRVMAMAIAWAARGDLLAMAAKG